MPSPRSTESHSEPDRPPLTPGTLYLVPTPIGNLEDITLRAIRTLKECDLIAAEDTRRTGLLLKHLGFSKPLLSCHQFNEARRGGLLLHRLKAGEIVALVSDAGSPGISDPGEGIVREALREGIRVESLPGPCALTTALAGSGLPTHRIHFVGFLPRKSGQRQRVLEGLRHLPATLIFYESPYRIDKLLGELALTHGRCPTVLAREMTKKFEEYLRGIPEALLKAQGEKKWRGEFVVLVDNNRPEAKPEFAGEAT